MKKIWLNNKIKQIEEAHKQNNAKKSFKDTKQAMYDDFNKLKKKSTKYGLAINEKKA
jgi:predicted RNA-binding protein YlxR (DUF448 family)